jgi:hypothetical protein
MIYKACPWGLVGAKPPVVCHARPGAAEWCTVSQPRADVVMVAARRPGGWVRQNGAP